MTNTNEPEKDLDNIVKQETNQNSGRSEEQASRAQQSRASSAADSSSKGWSTGQKVIVGGGAAYLGYRLVRKKIGQVWDYFHPVEPKKLGNAALSIGLIYFLLHPVSCSNQIKDGFKEYVSKPAKEYVSGRKQIEGIQKERDAAQQRIKELTTVRKPAPSLDKRVDQGYVPQASQVQPQVVKSFSSYLNPRLGSLTKPASVQSLESVFREKGTSYDHLVYIDKSSQTLTLFDIRDGSISAVKKYACTTGMNDGPRQSEGDKRTPEGVYNIDRCFGSTGNPLLGDRFMGIDYPNQYDMSAGRSGKGIGISGTGLTEREYAINSGIKLSNGGVVMKNSDVNELYNHIASSIGNTLVLIEDQRRPIIFEK